MKKVIILLLVLVGLAAAGWWYHREHPQTNDRLVVSGTIELTQVDIGFKTAGRLTSVEVKEGDAVRKGQVIARLDQDQLIRQREREAATLASAEAALGEATSALQFQEATTAADLDIRRAAIGSAQARLRELKRGSRPEEIEEAQATVAVAQAEYDRAQRDWGRAQALVKSDDISTSQFDDFRRRFEAAVASLKQAKQRSALVAAGPRSETIDEAGSQVTRAEAELKLAEAKRIETQRTQQELAVRQAEIQRSRAQLALVESQIADTVAVSPIDGVVLVKAADAGEVVAPGTAVVTLGDIRHTWLQAYIKEADLGRVKLGQKWSVTTDSFPGKVYEGRVSFISSEAEFTPKQIQTAEERVKLVYRISIDIDNPRQELKSKMPADAEIVLEKQ